MFSTESAYREYLVKLPNEFTGVHYPVFSPFRLTHGAISIHGPQVFWKG
jgi:hypothetical protein